MCRWIAYIGKPMLLETLVTRPSQSLVEQSLNSRMSFKPDGTVLPTNGDGFGMGWYSDKPDPGLFKVPDPAWSNENIKELCSHISSGLFMAHIRAASTGAIQRTNAHPFKHGAWLFQHNGYISHFDVLRRDLQFTLHPDLFSQLRGTTDSETLFYLALHFGLEKEPKQAVERAIDHIRETGARHGLEMELLLSCAMSDGKKLYTFRYSSGSRAHSQYYSTHADCMQVLGEENDPMPKNSVVVVSEPLDQKLEHWTEMPVNHFATIERGKVDIEPLVLKA